MHFDSLQYNAHINNISELCRPVIAIKNKSILNCTAAMLLLFFAIIITTQLTSSVTWPFDSSPAVYYRRFIVTMGLSCTVIEIWCLKDNRVTTLIWGHVTSSVTWPFDSRWASSYGWSIVTMRLSCSFMDIWHLKRQTLVKFRCHGNRSKSRVGL